MKILRWQKSLANLVLLAVTSLMIGPSLLVLNIAFKSNEEFLKAPLTLTKTLQFHNFVEAWLQADMGIFFKNSVIYTVVVSIGTCVIAAMAAYPVARNHFRGSKYLYLIFLSALFIPSSLVALLFVMKFLGLINSYHGFILFKIASSLPMAVFILVGFMKGVPRELDEAAEMDGCGYLRYIFSIIFPLIQPAFSTVAMLTAINTWNDFISPFLLITDKSLRPLTSGLFLFFGQYSTNWTLLSAGIIVVTLPLVILFIFLQRYIISGVTSGAIKG